MHIKNKIKKKAGFNVGLLLLLFLNQASAYGQVASLADILNHPDRFNERRVEIEGEIIGELLKADKGLWINISSADQSMGVFLFDKEAVGAISHWGRYKVRGDRVKIEGVFYKDCPLHHVMDIHLDRLEVLEQGRVLEDSVPLFKVDLSIVFFVICLTMAIIYFIKLKHGTRT